MTANEAWIAMFRRIPVHLHDALALGLTTGAELVIQKIVKLEPDFMIIRGRLAGTLDAGRVVMVPYTQLTFVAVLRDLQEAEVESVFGKAAPAAVADVPPPAAVEAAPAAEPLAAEKPPSGAEPAKRPPAVSKSVLVAKLRDRLKNK